MKNTLKINLREAILLGSHDLCENAPHQTQNLGKMCLKNVCVCCDGFYESHERTWSVYLLIHTKKNIGNGQ